MKCRHCTNDVPNERIDLGFRYCTSCAAFYTQELRVVPMGSVMVPVKTKNVKTETKTETVKTETVKTRTIKAIPNGRRFLVTTKRDETIVDVNGNLVNTIRVSNPEKTLGFDRLDNALEYAETLDSPRVRDTLRGGVGQILPTPDRIGNRGTTRHYRY